MGVHGFRRSLTGRVQLRADEVERSILLDLVGQLEEFVAPDDDWADADPLAQLVGIDPEAQRPDDPALARLFPDAYRDDDDAAAEFRRFTERSLRDTKLAHARTVAGTLRRSGDKLVLTEAEAQSWLGTLNDLRLTLGSRLGVQEDNHDEFLALPEDHPLVALYHVYDWLTYLQETLVHALTGLDPGLDDEPDGTASGEG
ncbi:MAG: DUF2017 family protein [Frankiales bacterium]|nr:DUF2017 family protein [Frankiales bacterium]